MLPQLLVARLNIFTLRHEPFQANQRTAFHGTRVACLRATTNAGEITLTASVKGLTEGVIKIQAAASVK
jgi:hypothetical protein